MARFLMDAGFHSGPLGMHLRRIPLPVAHHDAVRSRASCNRMPEGDTIFRTARSSTARSSASRSPASAPPTRCSRASTTTRRSPASTVERVESRGKWLLIHFSGGGILATHMLMSGSWHIYRPGERWQQPRVNMRIVIENSRLPRRRLSTCPWREMHTAQSLARDRRIPQPADDVLSAEFDADSRHRRVLRAARTKKSATCCCIRKCSPA